MTTFLKLLCDELKSLGKDGVELKTADGESILYHVYGPLWSVDSGAKPKLARHRAHNGKCPCGYCTHPSIPVPGYALNQLRLVERDANKHVVRCTERTHRSVLADMLKADVLDRAGKLKPSKDGSTQDHVNGVLGISPLAGVPKFDLVYGYVIDYLHTLLLGILFAMLNYIFENKEAASEIPTIDKRLSGICPPHTMAAQKRLLSEISDWKGKELRLFGLYFVLPCFQGLRKIPARRYEQVRKFVVILQIVLSSYITEDQLQLAERLVNEFVSDFQDLFGAIHMTLNPHLLKHIIKIVRAWGPVSCYSILF